MFILHCVVVFIATATPEIFTYGHTLSLHYALPICRKMRCGQDSISAGAMLLPAMSASDWVAKTTATFFLRSVFSQSRMRPANSGLSRKRSEEHTSELQSLMRISYAVFCLKKKKIRQSYTCDTTRNTHTRHMI